VATAAQPADKTAAGFTFYHGYLSVVYGLVATEGLVQLGTIEKPHEWEFGIPPFLLLFQGVFVIGLHFWFICSTVDESSHKFYRALAGDRWAYAFFFVDAIVATSFAWLVLAMFHGISSRRDALFPWFLLAAAGSLAYDLYSRILVSAAGKESSQAGRRQSHHQLRDDREVLAYSGFRFFPWGFAALCIRQIQFMARSWPRCLLCACIDWRSRVGC